MSILTPVPPGLSLPARVFFAIPIIGWIARDVSFGAPDNIWYALIIALTALVLAVSVWGIVALGLVAVGLTPVVFVLLILISRG